MPITSSSQARVSLLARATRVATLAGIIGLGVAPSSSRRPDARGSAVSAGSICHGTALSAIGQSPAALQRQSYALATRQLETLLASRDDEKPAAITCVRP